MGEFTFKDIRNNLLLLNIGRNFQYFRRRLSCCMRRLVWRVIRTWVTCCPIVEQWWQCVNESLLISASHVVAVPQHQPVCLSISECSLLAPVPMGEPLSTLIVDPPEDSAETIRFRCELLLIDPPVVWKCCIGRSDKCRGSLAIRQCILNGTYAAENK